jgi:hypothetical protein
MWKQLYIFQRGFSRGICWGRTLAGREEGTMRMRRGRKHEKSASDEQRTRPAAWLLLSRD